MPKMFSIKRTVSVISNGPPANLDSFHFFEKKIVLKTKKKKTKNETIVSLAKVCRFLILIVNNGSLLTKTLF